MDEPMTAPWTMTEAHFVWTVSAEARRTRPGAADVEITARNALIGEMRVTVGVDWKPGQEKADVEAHALSIGGLLYKKLGETMLVQGGARMTTGETDPSV
jgi:hypothetical protein